LIAIYKKTGRREGAVTIKKNRCDDGKIGPDTGQVNANVKAP
jgi:hypothetical protein